MTALLIILAIIVLLALLPLGISFRYDADGVGVRLIVGFLKFRVYPGKKKKEKPEKPVSEAEKEPEVTEKPIPKAVPKEAPEKAGGSFTDFIPLAKTALSSLNVLRRKVRVKRLEVKLVMAGDDPSDLALNYGRAWTALGNLWPYLETYLVIEKRDVDIQCDFTAQKTTVTARVDVTVTLSRLLCWVCKYGWKAYQSYTQIMNKRKGGALK
jgi:hypothetical protein